MKLAPEPRAAWSCTLSRYFLYIRSVAFRAYSLVANRSRTSGTTKMRGTSYRAKSAEFQSKLLLMSSKRNHTVILKVPSYMYRMEVTAPTPRPWILRCFLGQSLHPKQQHSPMLSGNNYFRKPIFPFSLCPPAKTQRGFLLYHQPLCPPLDESRSKPAYKRTCQSPVIKP